MSCSCGELNLTLIIMGKHGSYQVQPEHRYKIQTVYPFFDPYGPYGSTDGLYGPLLCGSVLDNPHHFKALKVLNGQR